MNMKRLLSTLFIFLIFVMIRYIPVSASSGSEVEIHNVIKIDFEEFATIEDIDRLLEENKIYIHSFTVSSDGNISSGYTVTDSPANFKTLWYDFYYKQHLLLSEGIEYNNGSTASDDMKKMLESLRAGEYTISVICYIPVDYNEEILNCSEIISEINNYSNECGRNVTPSTGDRTSNWVPTSGFAVAQASQNISDATYLEVHYMWNSASALSTLTNDSVSTLEGDLVFYNYDGNAISTAWYSGNVTYSTNQPYAYQDTQSLDDPNEPCFSIGCSAASLLSSNTDYYWIAYGNKTASTGCMAKLNFQRGYRLISNIYSQTWNVFGIETETVIPFSSWNTGNTYIRFFTH